MVEHVWYLIFAVALLDGEDLIAQYVNFMHTYVVIFPALSYYICVPTCICMCVYCICTY